MKRILLLITMLLWLFCSFGQSINKIEGDSIKLQKRIGGNTNVLIKGSLVIGPSGQNGWTFDSLYTLFIGNSSYHQVDIDASGDAYFGQRVDAPMLDAQHFFVLPNDTSTACTPSNGAQKFLLGAAGGHFYFYGNSGYFQRAALLMDTLTYLATPNAIHDSLANCLTGSSITGKVNYTDTPAMLSAYQAALNARLTIASAAATYQPIGSYLTASSITGKVNYTDTPAMLSAYQAALNARLTITQAASTYQPIGSYLTASSSLAWAKITSTPTTLSGYGITDAYPLSGNPSNFLTGNQSISIEVAGDVSGTSTSSPTAPYMSLTLQTVNSSPGSFGTGARTLKATVNGKGLITALTDTAISIAESQVVSLSSDLSAKVKYSDSTVKFETPTQAAATFQPIGSYLTANQTVTLSGVVTGSGSTAITTAFASIGAYKILYNNTNASAAPAANYWDTLCANGNFATYVRAAQNNGGVINGTISGGTSGRVALWSGSSTLTSKSFFTFDTTYGTLYLTANTNNHNTLVLNRSGTLPNSQYSFSSSSPLSIHNSPYITSLYAAVITNVSAGLQVVDTTGSYNTQGLVLQPFGGSVVIGDTYASSQYTSLFNVNGSMQANGNLSLKNAGNKLNIATGTNASVGTATLSSGTITVNTTAVTSSSIISLTYQNCSSCGTAYISARTASTSFTITSTNSSLG